MTVRIASATERKELPDEKYIHESDERLMAFFQSGDALAFHYLIERHRGLIWSQIRKYFGPYGDIEDVMQDVCLSLWQNRSSWKPGIAKFSTWLFRVVSNRCIDILRQKKEISTDSSFEHISSSIVSAEQVVSDNQTSHQLLKLLADLPEQQKLALQLFYYEEAEIAQICEKMALSDQAVRSLLKRGKQKLRTVLQSDSLHAC